MQNIIKPVLLRPCRLYANVLFRWRLMPCLLCSPNSSNKIELLGLLVECGFSHHEHRLYSVAVGFISWVCEWVFLWNGATAFPTKQPFCSSGKRASRWHSFLFIDNEKQGRHIGPKRWKRFTPRGENEQNWSYRLYDKNWCNRRYVQQRRILSTPYSCKVSVSILISKLYKAITSR